MDADRKRAVKRFVFMNLALFAVIAAFGAYSIIKRYIDIPLFKCYMSDIFHVYCAFCGGTRAIASLISGDIASALKYNLLIVYLAVALVIYEIQALYFSLKGREDALAIPVPLLWTSIAVFIGYCVVRNLLLICFKYDPLGELSVYW